MAFLSPSSHWHLSFLQVFPVPVHLSCLKSLKPSGLLPRPWCSEILWTQLVLQVPSCLGRSISPGLLWLRECNKRETGPTAHRFSKGLRCRNGSPTPNTHGQTRTMCLSPFVIFERHLAHLAQYIHCPYRCSRFPAGTAVRALGCRKWWRSGAHTLKRIGARRMHMQAHTYCCGNLIFAARSNVSSLLLSSHSYYYEAMVSSSSFYRRTIWGEGRFAAHKWLSEWNFNPLPGTQSNHIASSTFSITKSGDESGVEAEARAYHLNIPFKTNKKALLNLSSCPPTPTAKQYERAVYTYSCDFLTHFSLSTLHWSYYCFPISQIICALYQYVVL